MGVFVDDLYLYNTMLRFALEQKANGGVIDRRGQQKRSICNAHGPDQMIRSIIKQV
jgi:hypothetical protein